MNKRKLIEASNRFYDAPERFNDPNEGKDLFCYEEREIQRMAQYRYDEIPLGGTHLSLCERCAHYYIGHRSNYVDKNLPEEFEIPIPNTNSETNLPIQETCYQILGRIFLEDMSYDFPSREEWMKLLPLFMKTNLVYDPNLDFFSLTLLDCPKPIKSSELLLPDGWKKMELTEPISSLSVTYECPELSDEPDYYRGIWDMLEKEELRLRLRT